MKRLLFALAAASLALPTVFASAAIPERGAALKGAGYIRTVQLSDGGFAAAGHGGGQTMDAIFAIRAAGLDPNTFSRDGKTPGDFLKAKASEAGTGPGSAGKAALGARALNLDPRNVAGVDLVGAIEKSYDPATGKYADDSFTQSIAILGVACNGVDVPNGAVLALAKAQGGDGGWGFGGASDADTTAIAVQALIAGGIPASDARVARGIAFLKSSQADDGGWGFGGESNVSSTAYAVQALTAAGESPESAAYLKHGASPVTFLLAQQQADGSFKGFDPAFATNQALPALTGRTFCNAPATPVLGPLPNAPLPPNTGTGAAPGGHGGAMLLAAAALMAFGAGSAIAVRRRSSSGR